MFCNDFYSIANPSNEFSCVKYAALKIGIIEWIDEAEGNTRDNSNDVTEDNLDFILTLITLIGQSKQDSNW